MSEPQDLGAGDERRLEPVPTWVEKVGTIVGLVVFVALGVGVVAVAVVGVIQIYPDQVQQPDDADFLDNIFANEFVLFAARLVLFSVALVAFVAAAYIIRSVFEWSSRGQWLRRAGPFEVAEAQEAVSDLRNQLEMWQELAESSGDELDDLREQLQKNDELIDRLWDRINNLENENVELRAGEPPRS